MASTTFGALQAHVFAGVFVDGDGAADLAAGVFQPVTR
jgi:hypothetical protein